MPAISSGHFGFPTQLCAKILFKAILDFVMQQNNEESILVQEVRLTNFDEETNNMFRSEFEKNVELGVIKLI